MKIKMNEAESIIYREDNRCTGEVIIWDDKGNMDIYSTHSLLESKKIPDFIKNFHKKPNLKEIV